MFETLSEKLSGVFDSLTRQGALTEDAVKSSLREVRLALLEADVSLPVVQSFIARVQEKAVGASVLRSITPGQQVIKIVHQELKKTLAGKDSGESDAALMKIDSSPAPVLMVGLQGSGKTTTTAKLAKRFMERNNKKILMASLDVNRPAAMEQLAILGTQIGVNTLPIVAGQKPTEIAKRAMTQAAMGGYDVVMLDTAGRLHVDEALMEEVAAVREITKPHETLLVVDSLTGQDAVNVAKQFGERIDLSGIVLTRMDGDGRGGAALSMRAVTGKPIKFVGTGEKLDAIEEFHADRIAGRILDMGDVLSLVEKAQETIEKEEAERMMKRFKKGRFDMNDMRSQLEQMMKMGGMQGVMGMLPGMGKLSKKLDEAQMDDAILKRQVAIIQSMTKQERRKPDILQASRKRRIASGAGVEVQDVNKLLKMHRQMADMMKKMGNKGFMRQMMSMMGGGMPSGMPGSEASSADAQAALSQMPSNFGGGLKLPANLAGLGKKR